MNRLFRLFPCLKSVAKKRLDPAAEFTASGDRIVTDLECDVAVLGAGTAGLAAEHHARKAGASTLLIDPSFAGTTCATVGCMPSKLLIAAADAAWSVLHASEFGIAAKSKVDGSVVFARLRKERDRFVDGIQKTIAAIPDGIRIAGRASFCAADRLRLDDGRTVSARAIVIATGASPALPKPFDTVKDCVLTNQSIFELNSVPASVAVIGAGPLGLELGQALARLGSRVEIFDHGKTVAALSDIHVSKALCRLIERDMQLHLDVEPEVSPCPGGVRLSWNGASRDFERILLAVGRPPNLDTLNLAASGVGCDQHGIPEFDAGTMRCGESAVFIAGDANHDRPLLHEASHEGAIAGRNAANLPNCESFARYVPLAITFTRPESATVGTVPDPDDHDTVTGEASFDNQGRARVDARTGGLCRLYARRQDGLLTGASLAAPDGGHLAHLVAWAIEAGLTVGKLLDMPLYHPTYEEGLKPALRALCAATGSAFDQSRLDDGPCA